MQLSVIILNYNVRFFLEQCILSVQKALKNINSEIIVVDNASSDDSCAMMKEKFPHVKLIENKNNLGFPKGNNIGVAQAKGQFICILNPDTVVAEDTFTKILDFVKSSEFEMHSPNSQLGILGCKLIDGTGNFLPESKRGVPTPWVAFTKIFGLYKFFPKVSLFNRYYAQHLTENESGKVDILVGAFMFMKRDLYFEVGGFDENYFMYSEDIDLSYSVLKTGKSNYYFHETSVIHYKGESTVRDETYMKRFQEAMQFFYKKHFNSDNSQFSLFSLMMKFGTFAFSFFKKTQQKQTKINVDKYIIFSKEPINFQSNIPIEYLQNLENYKNQKNLNVEIIFNTNDFSFKEIIEFMNVHKAKNITFKNYISQSNFCIGSNSSNDRGQVVKL